MTQPNLTERADLENQLTYLGLHISKHEEQLEKLMLEILAQDVPSTELQNKMKYEKSIIQRVRKEYEFALVALHGDIARTNEDVRMHIKAASQAMLETGFERKSDKAEEKKTK
ncbi:hypothetical protein EJ07DRAFT_154266 [Lizonia empirigonia]|nr:hypothetical protein EJ07DRAFT_154266 [Lizonia empirigonia]